MGLIAVSGGRDPDFESWAGPGSVVEEAPLSRQVNPERGAAF